LRDDRRPPPRLRPRWPGAYATLLARSPLGFVQRVAAEAGRAGSDLVRVRAGGRTIVVVTHPELMREVLVTQQRRFGRGFAHQGLRLFLGNGLLTSEDPLHRRQRRLAQPAFHRERIAGYARVMAAAAERWHARWAAAAAKDGEAAVDVAAEMNALTLGIAGETLFGARVEGAARDVAEAVGLALRVSPDRLPAGGGGGPTSAASRCRRAPVQRAARARLDAWCSASSPSGGARAPRARTPPTTCSRCSSTATDPDAAADGGDAGPMSDAQLRDEVMTLFLAGHETTASALAWTWHLLAEHPPAQERLHAELDGCSPTPTAAARAGVRRPARLPYARMVLSEAMRLYPPAYAWGACAPSRPRWAAAASRPAGAC
jgi:cytochrome P450